MFPKILLLTWTLHVFFRETHFSLVIDSISQKGIVVSDYCPKMKYCEEGAHVMCMYYTPGRMMGPRCSDPKNVSMTSELAIKLLEVVNAIRGKVAMGLEKGKGGVELPRAYGMFKLQWDNELATFAQVLANQCVLRHDMCRATKRFPDPGQTAGLVRFSIPDWYPVSKGGHFITPGLTPSKVTYAVTQALKSWYSQKAAVTPAMIIGYPDWNLNPVKQNGHLYLEMISGPATHMGCGISAYMEYAYFDNRAPLNYNSIQVICNFSARPKKHKTVYDLEPQVQSSPCGCPRNAVEDENCLCTHVEVERHPQQDLNCDGVTCEQPVILLPIFTVEDAPPSKLIGRQGVNDIELPTLKSHQFRPNLPNSLEFADEDFPANSSNIDHPIDNVIDGIMKHSKTGSGSQLHEPNRRILEKSQAAYKQSALNPNHQQKKPSIFSRAFIIGSKTNSPLKFSLKDFKKDVEPRKDFSKAKYLLNNYMESIKNYSTVQYRPLDPEFKDKKSKRFSSALAENLNNAEDNLMIYHYDNDTFHPKTDETGHESDGDTKLMILLDKLEEEVQHIELKGNKKELFDAKIRKIYDSVVRKSSGLSASKTKHFPVSEYVNKGIDKLKDHDHDLSNKLELTEEHKDKIDDSDVGKTIDDIIHFNNDRNLENRNNIDEDGNVNLNRRMRIKTRINTGFMADRDSEAEYDYRLNPKSAIQADKLSSIYRDLDKDYKPYRFLEHRKSYRSKHQDPAHEDFRMNRFNTDNTRKGRRYKHTRDYYKNRDNSIENYNLNHYRRHQTRNDDVLSDDDVLGPERRKYYQERLDNLERKFQSTRLHKYRNEEDHLRRPLRLPILDDDAPRRPNKNRLEHFDMRERSRFLHGY